jgi:hypothetical protein
MSRSRRFVLFSLHTTKEELPRGGIGLCRRSHPHNQIQTPEPYIRTPYGSEDQRFDLGIPCASFPASGIAFHGMLNPSSFTSSTSWPELSGFDHGQQKPVTRRHRAVVGEWISFRNLHSTRIRMFNFPRPDFWPAMVYERALRELQERLELQHSFLLRLKRHLR